MTKVPFRSDLEHSPRARRAAALPWVFFGFIAVAGFFFFTEHRAHLMGALPFVLLALCPLMHFFHGGHGHHGSADARRGHGTAGPPPGEPIGGTGGQSQPASTPSTPPPAPFLPHQH